MEYHLLTWHDIYDLTLQLSETIVMSGFKPDLIVGIARGGWIPARILSDTLNTSMLRNIRVEYYIDIGVTLDTPQITEPFTVPVQNKQLLVVDDVADTGASFNHTIEFLSSLHPQSIKTAALILKPWSTFIPDYWRLNLSKWIIFPWAYRETIIDLTKNFKKETPNITLSGLRTKLVDEVGFNPQLVDYFLQRL